MHGVSGCRFVALLLCCGGSLLSGPRTAAATSFETCLLEALQQADNDVTVGELRARCQARLADTTDTIAPPAASPAASPVDTGAAPTALQQRLAAEIALTENPWVITPHKPNYLLPISYTSHVNRAPFTFSNESERLRNQEAKFQISFKFPLAYQLFDGRSNLYFAYTNQSYWQVYADDISSPFRETNHEPEFFLTHKVSWEVLGWKSTLLAAGYIHQSNGRQDPLSRSWDRLHASAVFERDHWAFGIKPWYIFPTDDDDDNPDIYKYMGYGELRLIYHNNGHVVTLMERNNLTSDSRGAVGLDYSFPLYGKLKGYLQYFYGYGDSLIDYDARTQRVGAGVAISDRF